MYKSSLDLGQQYIMNLSDNSVAKKAYILHPPSIAKSYRVLAVYRFLFQVQTTLNLLIIPDY